MNENSFDFLSDREISEMLTPFPPPDSVTQTVSPWRKATRQMLIGFALTAVVPQIFPLNHVFPIAGSILLFLGFKSLRKENKWFFLGFVLSWVILGLQAISLFLNSSIVRYTAGISAPFSAMVLISIVLIFMTSVSISAGFITVKKKLEYSASSFSPYALVAIMSLIAFLALINFTGAFAFFVLVAYVLVFIFLIKLSKTLDEIGYSIKIADVKNSDKTVATICLGLVFLISLTGYAFFSRYPMEWKPQVKTESAQLEEIKTNLLSLGFPEDVLSDLKDEDILKCENASFVTVSTDYQPFNNGVRVEKTIGNSHYVYTEYPEKELCFTFITVLLNEEKNHRKVFHHFKWVIDKGFFRTEGISLETPIEDRFTTIDDPSGQVLYNSNNITYVSPFFSAGNQVYESDSIFNKGEIFDTYFAEFSYPLNSEDKRGYVTYSVVASDRTLSANSILCYAHNKTPLQYPVKTAVTVLKNSEKDSLAFARRYNVTIIDTYVKLKQQ